MELKLAAVNEECASASVSVSGFAQLAYAYDLYDVWVDNFPKLSQK